MDRATTSGTSGTSGSTGSTGHGAWLGRMEEYTPDSDFNVYCERSELFFYINKITEDKMKSSVFLTFVGSEAYKVLKAAIQPEKVDSKTYEQIITVLKSKFAPKNSVIAERFKFYKRDQKPDESITEYAMELQTLAETCDFGTFLSWALRDKLVMGIQSARIQERLLTLDKDFDESLKAALASELTNTSVDLMKQSKVNFVNKKEPQRRHRSKSRSRQRSQSGDRERQSVGSRSKSSDGKKIQCFFCRQWGNHYAYNCPQKKGGQKRRNPINHAEDSSGSEVEDNVSSMFMNSVVIVKNATDGATSRELVMKGSRDSDCPREGFLDGDRLGSECQKDRDCPVKLFSDGERRVISIGGDRQRGENADGKRRCVRGVSECHRVMRQLRQYREDELLGEDSSEEDILVVDLKEEERLLDEDKSRDTINTVSSSKTLKFSMGKPPSAQLLETYSNGSKIIYEIDSGACVSCIHEHYHKKYFRNCTIQNCELNLSVVTGDRLCVLGVINVSFSTLTQGIKRRFDNMPLVVFKSHKVFVPLCGRNWIERIFPNWREAFTNDYYGIGEINHIPHEERILEKFANVFEHSEKSVIKGHKAAIVMKENCVPVFHKPYSVPYGIRDKVAEEIERLKNAGVVIPVDHSEWASPMVVVPKKNGDIRLCVDCSVTINKYVQVAHYPLPTLQEMCNKLTGAKYFCVLDLTGAYQQVEVIPECRKFLTVNTHLGLFQYTRLIFGLSSSPAIFQKTIDNILHGLTKTAAYIDDIIVGGISMKDCHENLVKVLQRLETFNVKVNRAKCLFFKEEVEFLGHVLSGNGVRPMQKKLEEIKRAKRPVDVTSLKAYLGLLTYYGKFIQNLSMKLAPLYKLLKSGEPFRWTEEMETVFQESKCWLSADDLLTHYNPDLPLVISVDASGEGVGAVLSHVIEGTERPILMVSSTLSPSERNYSIVEREALALVFAVKKFHQYIYARKVTVFTDHQCLRELFGGDRKNSAVAAARIQRWAIFLSMYDLKIVYKKGVDNGNADFLSRYPSSDSTGVSDAMVGFVGTAGEIALDEQQIREESQVDPVLSKLREYILKGFPPQHVLNKDQDMTPYLKYRDAFTLDEGIVYLGHKIVVPKSLQERVLKVIHEGHDGIVRMKAIARGCVWWPGVEKEIEQTARACETCQIVAPKPRNVTLSKWTDTSYPYERIHIDFFHWDSKIFLIIVDDFSKLIDVKYLKKTDVRSTIEALQSNFAIFGLPYKMVSDNGSPFQSREFAQFCKANRIIHETSPPYHPMSNGAAERAVQTVKKALKKFLLDERKQKLTISSKISFFLFRHNNTPSTVTSVEPNYLTLNYRPRTTISMLNKKGGEEGSQLKERKEKPRIVQGKKEKSKKTTKELKEGQDILYFHVIGHEWVRAKIVKQLSKTIYLISVRGTHKKCHRDQMKPFVKRVRFAISTPSHQARQAPQEQSPRDLEQSPRHEFKTPITRMSEPIQRKRRRRFQEHNDTPILRRSERIQKRLRF